MLSKRTTIIGLVILAIAGAFVFYALGYRLDSTLTIQQTSTITIPIPHKNVVVYMDNERRGFSRDENDKIVIRGVQPGKHVIIAARSDLVPWSKTLNTEYNKDFELRPFFVKYEGDVTIVPTTAFDYATRLKNATSYPVPTSESPLFSEDGSVAVMTDGGTLTARRVRSSVLDYVFCPEKCSEMTTIATFEVPVKNIAFYPGRNDVLIIAVSDGIFVIELDKRETQNFAPLYIGIAPTFKVTSDRTIDVADKGNLLSVGLQ